MQMTFAHEEKRKMITKIEIEWSGEDKCYVGYADGDNGKTYFSFEGNTVAEAMVDCINSIMDIYELKANDFWNKGEKK